MTWNRRVLAALAIVLAPPLLIGIFLVLDFYFLTIPASLAPSVGLSPLTGDSMEPTFGDGVLVYAEQDTYTTGDIIIFSAGDVYVTHRIVSITDDGRYITKGDGNDFIDQARYNFTVTSDDIIGSPIYHLSTTGIQDTNKPLPPQEQSLSTTPTDTTMTPQYTSVSWLSEYPTGTGNATESTPLTR